MLQFVVVGQGCAVGVEQAVGAFVAVHLEAAVLRRKDALFVAIAALELNTPLSSRRGVGGEAHALVGPLPDGATGNARRALNDFPLAVVVLERDAERVAVFGEDDGAVKMLVEPAYLARRGVVGRVDGGGRREWRYALLCRAFLPEAAEVGAYLREAVGPRRVERTDVVAHLDAGLCQRVLVAHAPYEHGGVQLVALDGGQGTLHEDVLIAAVREVLVAIAEGHLVDEIEAQRVGQLVEARFARIVRQAQKVNRRLLHQAHVLQGKVVGDDLHGQRVGAVRIDASQLDGLSIHLQDVSGNCNLADANFVGKGLQRPAFLLDVGAQGI